MVEKVVLAGTLFGYLAAFVTILVALAIGDLATSAHRLLRARARVAWDPVPVLAAGYILLTLLTIFFSVWRLTTLTELSFIGLVVRIVPVFLLFLAAAAVLPDEVPPGPFDLGRFYRDERRYIFGTLAIGGAVDQAQVVSDNWIPGIPPLQLAISLLVVSLPTVLCVVMAWRPERRVHWLCLVGLYALSLLTFVPWTVAGLPATG